MNNARYVGKYNILQIRLSDNYTPRLLEVKTDYMKTRC